MEDERLAQIEKAKLEAINQSNNTYDQMHQDNQNMLDQNMNYAEQFEKTQNETLDKQLDFYKQNIEQQKKNAQQNYETEAKKAQNDFVAYQNPYGYNAETMASKGQLQSGLSQTAQLGGYNAYQNRLATANKAMNDAFTQYDLDMNEAIINNDVQKAQNALAKLEMILGFQQNFYDSKNQISQSQLSNNQALDESYHGRYMDMMNQINTEKAQAEAIRQWEAQMAYQKERDKVADAKWQKEYNLSKKSVNSTINNNNNNGGVPKIGDTDPLVGTETKNGRTIVANPSTGTVNPDAVNGVFKMDGTNSGYQPNNVDGYPVSKYGLTVSQYYESKGNKAMDGTNIDNQNIWKYFKGDTAYLVVWDGSQNKYVQISTQPKSNFS
jgi:hypothetical protein